LIALLIAGLPLAPTPSCGSFLQHLLMKIDDSLLAHTLGAREEKRLARASADLSGASTYS
jgi:hypothetical protein